MKAYRLHEFSGAGGLRLDELPDPVPGPGQVLVRMRAFSLNFRDSDDVQRHLQPQSAASLRPGFRRRRRSRRDRRRA